MAAALERRRGVGRGAAAPPRYAVTRVPAAGREIEVRDSLLPDDRAFPEAAEGFEGILVVSDSTLVTGKASDYLGANVASFDDMRELEQAHPAGGDRPAAEGLGVDPGPGDEVGAGHRPGHQQGGRRQADRRERRGDLLRWPMRWASSSTSRC